MIIWFYNSIFKTTHTENVLCFMHMTECNVLWLVIQLKADTTQAACLCCALSFDQIGFPALSLLCHNCLLLAPGGNLNATCSTNTDFSHRLLLAGKEQRESTKACGSKPQFLLRGWSCGVEKSYQVVLGTHNCSQREVLWARQSPLLHHPQTIQIYQCHFSLFPLYNIKCILFMSWEPKICGNA